MYFWLGWVFASARRLSSAAASGDCSFLWYMGFSLRRLLLLQSEGPKTEAQELQHMGSAVVAFGLSFPRACGIFPTQGSNLCPLHWQVDS